MAIKLPIKLKSLASRIALGYLVLLLVSLLAVGIAFHSLVREYLIRDAQDSLLRESRAIAGIAARTLDKGNSFRRYQGGKMVFMLASRFAEGDFILTDPNLIIIDSSLPSLFPPGSRLEGAIADILVREGLSRGEELRFSTRDFVAVAVPVAGNAAEVKGIIILLTAVEAVRAISGQLARLLAATLAATGVLTVLVAVGLAQGITRPLRLLKKKTQDIASRNFSGRVDIQTGDEIEELADSFNVMAERLKEYDAAQRRFLQNASHELKTPLMSIQGYAEAVRDGVVGPEEVNKSLEVIIRESQRIKKMVEDIIYLSKLESFEEEYVFSDVEVEELVHEAVVSVSGFAREKNVNLEFSPSTSTIIKGDGEKILRVFVNILGNAIRHAKNLVSVRVERGECGRVRVVFQDDGPGFSQQDLERLFERFYKGSKGSSGLGMAIAHAIVKAHGGDIRAGNTETGARVEVCLPAGR